MNTRRKLAIAVALALLTTAGATIARDGHDRGYNGPRDHYSERHHRRDHREHGHSGRHKDRHDGRFEERFDKRQEKQLARIRKGWRSGDLTQKELEALRQHQRRIERMQERFDEDGRYSKAERERLKAALKRSDRRIKAARHHRDQRHRQGYDWWQRDHRGYDGWRRDRHSRDRYAHQPWQSWQPWYRWTD